MSGKKMKLLRKEAKKRFISYKRAKCAFKKLPKTLQVVVLGIDKH